MIAMIGTAFLALIVGFFLLLVLAGVRYCPKCEGYYRHDPKFEKGHKCPLGPQ